MFLIFSSNFAGTDIFPGLPLLRYPSSILPLFPRPPLTLGHIPRAISPIQSSSPALFLASSSASSLVLFLVLFIASSSPLPLPSHSSPPPSFASTYPHQHFLTSHLPTSRNHSRHSPHQHLASPIFARPFNHFHISPPTLPPLTFHFPEPLPSPPQDISKNSPLNAPSNLLFSPFFSFRFSARPEILLLPPNPRPIFWPII